MEYIIHGKTRRLKFRTDLIFMVYENNEKKCCFSIEGDGNGFTPLMDHWFDNEYLSVMMFDKKQLFISVQNDETIGELKEKLIKLGIEVLKDEICSSKQRQTV
jgi:hypothetical protein